MRHSCRWFVVGLGLVFAVGCSGSRTKPVAAGPLGSASGCKTVSWVRQFASSASSSIFRLVATSDGGVVAIADAYGEITVRDERKSLGSITPEGKGDGVVVKFTADGRLDWARRIGATESHVGLTAIGVRADGTIVVAGMYDGAPVVKGDGKVPDIALPPVAKATAVGRMQQLFFAFYGPDGTPRHIVTSNAANGSRYISGFAAIGNDVVAVGTFEGELSLGTGAATKQLRARGNSDAFVMRFDATGQPVWARRIGGIGSDDARAVAVDSKGGSVFVAGAFRIADAKTLNAEMTLDDGPAAIASANGRQDAFLMELDGSGKLRWCKALGGANRGDWMNLDEVQRIATTAEGDLIVLGNASLPLRFGDSAPLELPDSDSTPFLARIGSGGRLSWMASLGDVNARDLVTLADGDIVLTAEGEQQIHYLTGTNQRSIESAGLSDMLLARHAPDGSLRWVARFGGDLTEWGSGVAVGPTGAVFAAGRYYGHFQLASPGCSDVSIDSPSQLQPNSFLLRLEPGANPSDPDRERRIAERKSKVAELRKRGADALAAEAYEKACPLYRSVTELVPDEPAAWNEFGSCMANIDNAVAASAHRRALVVASRYHSVIDPDHEAARQKAYAALAALDITVELPKLGACGQLAAAPGCKRTLFACVGSTYNSETGVRIATSRDEAALDALELTPVAPALEHFSVYGSQEAFAQSHHWFERADKMDVLLESEGVNCKVVVADACLGLVGLACDSGDNDAQPTKTVDEFYLWRPEDKGQSP
ncbi:MAG TPA: hypothetical protein VIV60_10615 [Polyangiaceae bacterium]